MLHNAKLPFPEQGFVSNPQVCDIGTTSNVCQQSHIAYEFAIPHKHFHIRLMRVLKLASFYNTWVVICDHAGCIMIHVHVNRVTCLSAVPKQ